jgi:hypothetical protein
VGLKQNTVADKIKEIDCFLKELSDIPISEIPIKFKFLADFYTKISEFSPQLYNIWNKQVYDQRKTLTRRNWKESGIAKRDTCQQNN